ncbi:MAG: SGNH/GDSL hydrolase family protein [Bryobacteraceae bacterium]
MTTRLALGTTAFVAGAFLWAAAAPAPPAKKKPGAGKTSAKRRAPKAPPVSPKVRGEANETVNQLLERAFEIPIENAAALVPFFEQLYRSQKDPAGALLRILHFGDSHTASDDLTGAVRSLLQGQFGDGGGGYSLAGRPFRSYRRLDLKSAATKGWLSEGLLKRDTDGLYGLGGVGIWTRQPRESISLKAECRYLEIFYLTQPGGGPVEFYDNGSLIETIATEGEFAPGYYRYESPNSGSHVFELKTVARAPVRLFGWVTEMDHGITYESMGINGAQASIIFRWDEGLLASQLQRRNPALIVLAYGTNEASNPDWTLQSYEEMFGSLLRRLRRAIPTASILVVGPPDRYLRSKGRWAPFERIDRIVTAQRQAAVENRCAFYDLREKMGGAGAMRQWVLAGLAQYDHVHFTSSGYRRLGYVLFQDLVYNYQKYTKVRDELARQIPNDPTNTDR